jgi:lactate dehydrogenase-like 2-hydroxyacid dehydrogenase
VDLDTIWKESQCIFFCIPLTPDTKHMVNENSISKMKDGVVIINTSRGAIVDSQALLNALKR